MPPRRRSLPLTGTMATMTTADFGALTRFMATCRERVDEQMARYLPDQNSPAPRLAEAMRYAALGGGKRIRPVLVYGSCLLAGGRLEDADVPAVVIELIHAYSLVHDDLPAMDDDALRRGRATTHIAFDEATAILAGDTLHTLAFELLANAGDYTDSQRINMVRQLSHAAGAEGMAAGQMQDMEANGQALSLSALERVHYLKTGRLITAALALGAIAAEATPPLRQTLRAYGDAIGLAFQIQDDILDVTAATEELGKPSGSDLRHAKSTFPGLLGIDGSRARAADLCQQACALLDAHDHGEGVDTRQLKDLAAYIVARTH